MFINPPRLAVAFCGMIVLCGCREKSRYPLAPVSGTVKLDGQPLADAFVNFQPKGGLGSTGITDAEGKYTLSTIQGEVGAVVGTHIVSIYSVHSQEAPKTDTDEPGAPVERVPGRYNYETTLTLVVPKEGTREANWDLSTSSVRGRR